MAAGINCIKINYVLIFHSMCGLTCCDGTRRSLVTTQTLSTSCHKQSWLSKTSTYNIHTDSIDSNDNTFHSCTLSSLLISIDRPQDTYRFEHAYTTPSPFGKGTTFRCKQPSSKHQSVLEASKLTCQHGPDHTDEKGPEGGISGRRCTRRVQREEVRTALRSNVPLLTLTYPSRLTMSSSHFICRSPLAGVYGCQMSLRAFSRAG